ncbi:hypothetical protein C483_04729 [Natrialba hulunbeirensis JCM 10989]|uniref:Uncharacterized protein n=1 Tax=Natrialba hulunbeirensis JCM 10989 TaxID=1227493 RepID=M0A5D1_9EURY|nr:hypothetical protein [Natrialba hulunbeirensis]ELY93955.1 hypothetical protein C483_04729 [Natrialba hulunbeirensis JCM 10989]
MFSLLVLLLLVGSFVYPASFANPYHSSATTYAVAHESTEAFNETVERDDVNISTPKAVDDLSPATQQAFQEAIVQPPEYSEHRGYGWQRLGSVRLCHDSLLLCDEYAESPAFPTNVDAYETYGLVANGDEVYLTHAEGGKFLSFSGLFRLILVALFSPYLLFLGALTFFDPNVRPAEQVVYTAGGVVIGGFGFAFPYLAMFELVPQLGYLASLLIGASWLAICVGSYTHWRRITPSSVQSDSSD